MCSVALDESQSWIRYTEDMLVADPSGLPARGVHPDDADDESDSNDEEDVIECACVSDGAVEAAGLPAYASIYLDASNDANKIHYFIGGVPVTARITQMKRDSHVITLFHPILFNIELRHGDNVWTIRRRYRDIYSLHRHLKLFRAKEKMVRPIRRLENLVLDRTPEIDASASCSTPEVDDEGVPKIAHAQDSRQTENSEITLSHSHKHSHVDRPPPKEDECNAGAEVLERPEKRTCKLPKLPIWNNLIGAAPDEEHSKETVERYLNVMLHFRDYRNHKETREFLEVSRVSFVGNLGLKKKEGILKKRPGGRRSYHGIMRCCIEYFAAWNHRWIFFKDSYVGYLNPKSQRVRSVMLFDSSFRVRAGAVETYGVKNGLLISNLHRNLLLKCKSEQIAQEWGQAIKQHMKTGPGHIWLQCQRYDSCFPSRRHCYCHWLVDGKSFMDHLANMLELAKEEIFITDWWLSPEVYLKRPAIEGTRWRLDEVLRRKAQQGVHIFILLYKEVEMALGICSSYSKKELQKLHPNIKVLRHPDHIPGSGVFLWAHHEKVVVIDQNIAFVGGIDLCYGRWDDDEHRLTDLGSVGFYTDYAPQCEKGIGFGMRFLAKMIPVVGLGTSSEISVQFSSAPDRETCVAKVPSLISKKKYVAETKKTGDRRTAEKQDDEKGASTSHGFRFQRAVHSVTEVSKDYGGEATGVRTSKRVNGKKRKTSIAKYIYTLQMIRKNLKNRQRSISTDKPDALNEEYEVGFKKLDEESKSAVQLVGGGKYWLGKDYVNFIFKDFTDLNKPYNDFIDRGVTPRMPWHDLAVCAYGKTARDVARHFIERWNACKVEKVKDDDSYPFLMPKSYETCQVPPSFRTLSTKANVQVLRSCCQWSAGRQATENSIHAAYLDLIANARHYIYIENQFFISLINSGYVQNGISKALCDRILRAHRNKETFRVYVVLPLLPGFEGQIETSGSSALQVVLHWTYKSIVKGPHSLLANLLKEIDDPSQYIVFCSLRTHDELLHNLVTELVYIHSKCIMVDDCQCIIGSANINDRSMLGKRDSEVALLVEDTTFRDSLMNGKPFKAGNFVYSLRQRLFSEHLGIIGSSAESAQQQANIDLRDPICEDFFEMWKRTARRNTQIFERVFSCIPTDQVRSFEDLNKYCKQISLAVYDPTTSRDLLKELCGRVVEFPLLFLSQSDLSPSPMTKEGLAPSSIFT